MLQYNTIFLAKNLLFTRQKKLNLEFKKKVQTAAILSCKEPKRQII